MQRLFNSLVYIIFDETRVGFFRIHVNATVVADYWPASLLARGKNLSHVFLPIHLRLCHVFWKIFCELYSASNRVLLVLERGLWYSFLLSHWFARTTILILFTSFSRSFYGRFPRKRSLHAWSDAWTVTWPFSWTETLPRQIFLLVCWRNIIVSLIFRPFSCLWKLISFTSPPSSHFRFLFLRRKFTINQIGVCG